MKHLIAFFLVFILAANAFAASGVCFMQHEVVSMQSDSMPCHDFAQDDVTPIQSDQTQLDEQNSHLCDCDKCTQYASSFVSLAASAPLVDLFMSTPVNHKSLNFSPNYRPPIQFSV
jgi:hypothetical protein